MGRAVKAMLGAAFLFATVNGRPALAQTPGDQSPGGQAEPDSPSGDAMKEYKLHLDNGVKLFQDQNYDAAIVEFEAAYAAYRKASPLINIALAHKARFRYPQAIEVLERALADHDDSMSDADKAAAQSAIDEMRGLLAYATVSLEPKNGRVTVDGQPASMNAPIALSPGQHEVVAEADGYEPERRTITVASGDKIDLQFTLKANQSYVRVVAPSGTTRIVIDGVAVGVGQYAGLLTPGSHTVALYPSSGDPFSVNVEVEAGKVHEFRPRPLPAVPPPPPETTKPKKEEPLPERGFYALAAGGLMFPVTHPFNNPETNSGAMGGLRVGYRVNTVAAFGFNVQFVDVSVNSEAVNLEDAKYSTFNWHLGPTLRLMTPTRTFRGYATLGGGLAHTDVDFSGSPVNQPNEFTGEFECVGGNTCVAGSGFDPYFMVELGFELDFSGVLVGAAVQTHMQSTKGIDPDDSALEDADSPWDDDPFVMVGPAIRAGYAFW